MKISIAYVTVSFVLLILASFTCLLQQEINEKEIRYIWLRDKESVLEKEIQAMFRRLPQPVQQEIYDELMKG